MIIIIYLYYIPMYRSVVHDDNDARFGALLSRKLFLRRVRYDATHTHTYIHTNTVVTLTEVSQVMRVVRNVCVTCVQVMRVVIGVYLY